MSDADYVQGGIVVAVIALCGVNIFLTMGMRTAIWRITKRIDSIRELIRKQYEIAPKKTRSNKQGRSKDD